MLPVLLLAEVQQQQQGAAFDWKMLLPFAVVFLLLLLMPKILRKNREERRRLEKQINNEVTNRLNVKSEADAILVEVYETGREINARLDNKIRLLNKLIKDADALVSRLEKAQGISATAIAVGADEIACAAVDETAVIERDQVSAQSERSCVDRQASSVAVDRVAEPAPSVEPQQDANGSGRWKADMRSRIAGLSAEGRDASEIARITRMSLAEVTLMLELIKRDS